MPAHPLRPPVPRYRATPAPQARCMAGLCSRGDDTRRSRRVGDVARRSKWGQEMISRDEWFRMVGLDPEAHLNGKAAAQIEDVCAADVTTKPVEWEWEGRIPRGKLTMGDGDPGVGKTVVTMDIAARKSTGRPFPDG